MSQIAVNVDTSGIDSGHRARNIAIGLAVVIALTYWRITGSIPFFASLMVPQPESDNLMSVWSIGVEFLGDALYMIGVAATGFVSGLWSLVVMVIRYLIGRTAAPPSPQPPPAETVTREQLDKRTKQVFAAVEKPINDLILKVEQLVKQVDELSEPQVTAAKTRATTRTRKVVKP